MTKRKRRPGKPPTLDTQLDTIPERDLARVGVWLKAKFDKGQWTRFASWLLDYLESELRQRASGDDAPREATLLVVPPNWSNRDVADALECMTALGSAGTGTDDGISDQLGQFLDKLVIHVITMASDRLRSLPDYHTVN